MTERRFDEGFACRCREPARTESDERLAWASEFVSSANRDDPTAFVSYAVMDLMWAHDIDIVGIPVSQWYGIDYRPSLTDPEDNQSVGRVQCDRVEDGFALLLRMCFDKWGVARPGSDRAIDETADAASRAPSSDTHAN